MSIYFFYILTNKYPIIKTLVKIYITFSIFMYYNIYFKFYYIVY